MSVSIDAYGILDFGVEIVSTASPSTKRVDLENVRSGVLFSVDSTAAEAVYFKAVRRGGARPTISETTFHLRVAPGSDRTVNWGGPLDVYAYSPSTTTFTAVPVRF